MNEFIERFSHSQYIAVVGATDNPEKYGHKVFKKLLSLGKSVYPVHPVKKEIEGIRVYSSIAEIDMPIDAISLIVNPTAGLDAIKDAYTKNVRVVWCQPGAESDDIIRWCNDNGIACIYNRCVLVDL